MVHLKHPLWVSCVHRGSHASVGHSREASWLFHHFISSTPALLHAAHPSACLNACITLPCLPQSMQHITLLASKHAAHFPACLKACSTLPCLPQCMQHILLPA
eukprot:424967-Pelagomonas_calceolata.AAC.1